MPPEPLEQSTAQNPANNTAIGNGLSESAQNALRTEFALRQQMSKSERADPNVIDLLGEAGYSALYMTAQSPVTGLSQLVDRGLDTNITKHLDLMPAPEHEEFGTARWHAQQIGGAAGMTLPFIATKGAMRKAGLSLVAKTEGSIAAASAGKLISPVTGAAIADGALTGFAYDFFLTPVQKGQGEFWQARTNHGLTGAATFGTLTAGSVLIRHAGRSVSSELVGARRVVFDVATGVGSGIPAGVVNADVGTRLTQGRWASGEERIKGAYTMAMVGGILSPFHRIPGQELSVGDKALQHRTQRAGAESLQGLLAERARSLVVPDAKSTPSRLALASDVLVGSRKGSRGSASEQAIKETSRPKEGRSLASTDIAEAKRFEVPPELQPVLQKGAEMALAASEANATPKDVVKLFQFAQGEGASPLVRDHLLNIVEQYGDPHLLTVVREAYLPLKGVEHRSIAGEMSIKPDPGKTPTEQQLQRWQQFLELVEKPPTDVEGYTQYRHDMINWLANNKDLHNWAKQYAEQTKFSNVAGPIDSFFGTNELARFMEAHRNEGRPEKPVTMTDIAHMRRVSQEFAENVEVWPYDNKIAEFFTSVVESSKEMNMSQLARHLNDALVKQKLDAMLAVGVDSKNQLTLYKHGSRVQTDKVYNVDYASGEPPAESGTRYDTTRSNEIANKFARELSRAEKVEDAQFQFADAALNMKELGVPTADAVKEFNWVLKTGRSPFEVALVDGQQLQLNYVSKNEGNFPFLSIARTYDGRLITQHHE